MSSVPAASPEMDRDMIDRHALDLASTFDHAAVRLVTIDGTAYGVVHAYNSSGMPNTPGSEAHRIELVTEDGDIVVTAFADSSHVVYWSDDWARVQDLKTAGVLTPRHGGPGTFGHVDYLVSE